MRSTIALGEKHMEGTYRRIFAAGDIWVENSKVKSIYAAGDVDVKNSEIRKLRIAGDFDGEKVVIDTGKVAGDITLKGVCNAKRMVVLGSVYADYLECTCLRFGSLKGRVTGKCDMSGFYKATTFENTIPLVLKCDYEFQNMIILDSLRSDGEIVCTNFFCLGKVVAPFVNAEEVFLLANAGTTIDEVVGTKITVARSFKPDKAFKALPKSIRLDGAKSDEAIISIGSITADKVSIECVEANSVSGLDVEIGDLSIVEEVTYQNSIKISDKAVVGRVVKQ